MFDAAAEMLSSLLIQKGIVPEDDREIYEFGFACKLADAAQLVLLALFALLSGLVMETACFAACFTTVKRHIGGWHAESHAACLCSTTAMTAASELVCVRIGENLQIPVTIAFLAVAATLVIRFAPVIHRNNPKTAEETRKHRKYGLLVLNLQAALILTAAATFPYWRVLPLCGSCGLFTAAFTLIIPNRKGGNDE